MQFELDEACAAAASKMPLCAELSSLTLSSCFRRPLAIYAVRLQARQISEFTGQNKALLLRRSVPGAPNIVSLEEFDVLVAAGDILLDGTFTLVLEGAVRVAFCTSAPELGIEMEAVPGMILTRFEWLSRAQKLQLVLPREAIPGAFETVGHIAHYNLSTPEQQRVKYFIGAVTLDTGIRTVVTKTENLTGEFRALPMELIAGEPNYVTTVRQQGFKFKVDLKQCYWNSRLEREHMRV